MQFAWKTANDGGGGCGSCHRGGEVAASGGCGGVAVASWQAAFELSSTFEPMET